MKQPVPDMTHNVLITGQQKVVYTFLLSTSFIVHLTETLSISGVLAVHPDNTFNNWYASCRNC